MARRKVAPVDPESWWLVQRVRGRDGKMLPRPSLYGRVRASSDTLAVERFLKVVGTNQDPRSFEARPA